MFSTSRLASMTALTLAATLGLAACGNVGENSPDRRGSPVPGAPSPTVATSPRAPSPASAPNDADVLFPQMMIAHQKQAVEMSGLMLAKSGIDPRVSSLAQKIKDARASENSQLSGLLRRWGASATPSLDMRHDIVGDMVSQADVRTLKQATGARSAALFLDDMIQQHQSAIGIAQGELDDGRDPNAKQLARDLIASEQSEINTMTQLRTDF